MSTEYVMTVPVHELATTEEYLAVLDGHPAAFAPGERFAYNNGGYVVLAILAERAGGVPYRDLVRRARLPASRHARHGVPEVRRARPAPWHRATSTLTGAFARNGLHLPVRGVGDGGAYSTVADMRSFWIGLFAGDIVSAGVGRRDGPAKERRAGARPTLWARLLAASLERCGLPRRR